METFAHFEIFDQQGNRAAEGHKVLNFQKNCSKVTKHDILYLVFAYALFAQHTQFYAYRVTRALSIYEHIAHYAFVQSVHIQFSSVHRHSWCILKAFDENI